MPSEARRLALDVLARSERGEGTLGELLATPDAERLPPRERDFLHELVLGTLRLRGSLDHALAPLLSRPLETADPFARAALRLGAHQLLHLRVPARAAVHESVALARERVPGAAGFVNAVLRRLSAAGPPRFPVPERDPLAWLSSEGSLPGWLAARWLAELGPRGAVARARALLRAPDPIFRTNPHRDDARARLAESGVEPRTLHVPGALAASGGRLAQLARDGLLYIQDLGSQMAALLAAELCGPAGPLLDACAAPGGKALLLADALAGRHVIASDPSWRRLLAMRELIARWGAPTVHLLRADARRPPFRCRFACVLLDAPCSGLGMLARRPDTRWRSRAEEIPRHAARQRALLEAALPLLGPGGALVYAVCSLEPEETSGVVLAFLAAHPELEPAPLPGWCERFRQGPFAALLPERDASDGFFAAPLRRRHPQSRAAGGALHSC